MSQKTRLPKAPGGGASAMRLDSLLVARGLSPSRDKAKRAIMAGLVSVEGQRVDKPGTPITAGAAVEVAGPPEPFVSRAGRKLDGALDFFGIDPAGRVCLDVGASTGGFTDCLLKRGALRVYAVDVGYGQLDHRLRIDPRVVVLDRINARYLDVADIADPCELITVDVSFISLVKVTPALLPHLAGGGRLLALIKPQFEAGREKIGKGGVIRDEAVREAVIAATVAELEGLGLEVQGVVDSEVAGARGNREAFGLFAQSCQEQSHQEQGHQDQGRQDQGHQDQVGQGADSNGAGSP